MIYWYFLVDIKTGGTIPLGLPQSGANVRDTSPLKGSQFIFKLVISDEVNVVQLPQMCPLGLTCFYQSILPLIRWYQNLIVELVCRSTPCPGTQQVISSFKDCHPKIGTRFCYRVYT